jgi:hypothetical protein
VPLEPVRLDYASSSPIHSPPGITRRRIVRLGRLLFHAQDGILRRFGHTEFYHCLCRDLDLLSGLGIKAGASFALLFNEFSKACSRNSLFVFVSR